MQHLFATHDADSVPSSEIVACRDKGDGQNVDMEIYI